MAIHYVRTDSTDGGDGTEDRTDGATRAFATIGGVNAHVLSAGDSVLFKRGQAWKANEKIVIGYSGSAGSPITYGAYGAGDKPIIHAGHELTSASWSAEGSGVYSQNYAVCSGILEDDVSCPKASNAANVGVDGLWFADGAKIYYKPSNASDPTANGKVVCRLVNGMAVDMTAITPVNYVTFQNLHFIGDGIYNGDNRSMTGLVVDSCDFTDCFGTLGIKAGNANSTCTIQDCSFTRCGGNIYLLIGGSYKWTATIQRNTFTAVNRTGFSPALYDHVWGIAGTGRDVQDRGAIELQNIENSTITQNLIGGSDSVCDTDGGISVWFNTALIGNTLSRNFIHDLEGFGIGIGGVNDIQVNCHYNIIIRMGTAKAGIQINNAQSSTNPSEVYNNTVDDCTTNYDIQSAPGDYVILKNNISTNPGTYHVNVENGTGILHNIVDYNMYYPLTANGGKTFASAYTERTYAEWKTATSQDANSPASADPLFLNAGGSYALDTDFKLQAASPCINEGVDVGLTTDYGGQTIIMPPNIGAWEFLRGSKVNGVAILTVNGITPASINGVAV